MIENIFSRVQILFTNTVYKIIIVEIYIYKFKTIFLIVKGNMLHHIIIKWRRRYHCIATRILNKYSYVSICKETPVNNTFEIGKSAYINWRIPVHKLLQRKKKNKGIIRNSLNTSYTRCYNTWRSRRLILQMHSKSE